MSFQQPHGLAARYAVLDVISDGKGAADLARLMKINRSNAFRRIQTAEREGLVVQGVKSSLRFWTLTAAGAAVLQHLRKGFDNRTVEEVLGSPQSWLKTFRWHRLLFRFPRIDGALEGEADRLSAAGFAGGRQGFVTGFWKRLNGWRVFVTGKSVLVYSPVEGIRADSVFGAVSKGLEEACDVVEGVCVLLPWLKVHSRFQLCRQELALMGVAEEWVPEGFRWASDRLVVDFSLGKAEVETVHRSYSVDDMLGLANYWDGIVKGGRV